MKANRCMSCGTLDDELFEHGDAWVCVECKFPPKRPSALAPRREPKVSLADLAEAFERDREGM